MKKLALLLFAGIAGCGQGPKSPMGMEMSREGLGAVKEELMATSAYTKGKKGYIWDLLLVNPVIAGRPLNPGLKFEIPTFQEEVNALSDDYDKITASFFGHPESQMTFINIQKSIQYQGIIERGEQSYAHICMDRIYEKEWDFVRFKKYYLNDDGETEEGSTIRVDFSGDIDWKDFEIPLGRGGVKGFEILPCLLGFKDGAYIRITRDSTGFVTYGIGPCDTDYEREYFKQYYDYKQGEEIIEGCGAEYFKEPYPIIPIPEIKTDTSPMVRSDYRGVLFTNGPIGPRLSMSR